MTFILANLIKMEEEIEKKYVPFGQEEGYFRLTESIYLLIFWMHIVS